MTYTPSKEILETYADVLVNYAPWAGKGVRKGDSVLLQVPECAKPLLVAMYKKVLEAGAHPIIQYLPDDMGRVFFDTATDEQLSFFPEAFVKGKYEQVDVTIGIIADTNKYELKGVDPARIMKRQKAMQPIRGIIDAKETAGNYFWTVALYGTQAMAEDVGLSLEDYWKQIITACYIDTPDAVSKWNEIQGRIETVKEKLDALQIEKVHVESEGTDLWVQLGDNRKWLGGSGHNIPSFEVFISPNWRGTNGTITFNQPLYSHGSKISGITLTFVDGLITKATAEEGEDLLLKMIEAEDANKLGEFSLTEASLSKITTFMGNTLYDENVGGEFGNTHVAIGMAYKDSFVGSDKERAAVTKDEWAAMGFNDSIVHTDIISTVDRKVTAFLKDGSSKVIYEHGAFSI
jgi:aminopeptidase